MKQIFEVEDILRMEVLGVTPKNVRLCDNEGNVCFISHRDFNLVKTNRVPLMYIKRTCNMRNQYGMVTEICFLDRVQRVVPQEVREKWMDEE